MNCKDCVHYEVCEYHEDLYIEIDITGELEKQSILSNVENECDHFKNKANVIDIPESGIGDLSDGYHTFNELYHHRAVLFSALCNLMPEKAWKSKLHDTGDMFEGMFIVGIETPEGPATYHYDIVPYWDMFKVKELEKAPKWDGHTSTDAINRIATLSGDFVDADSIIIEMDPQGIASYVMREELTTLLHTIEDHPEKTCPRKEGDSCDGCEYITESGNGCDSIQRRADYLIKNGVLVSQWISVKDRLPETNGKYLCADYSKTFEKYFIRVMSFAKDLYKVDEFDFLKEKGKSGFYGCDNEWGYYKCNGVSHWMPLPEPPKKEGAENDRA